MGPQECPLITSLLGWMLRQEQWRLTWLAWLVSLPLVPPYLRRVPRGSGARRRTCCPFSSSVVSVSFLRGGTWCSRGARARARVQVSRCCDRRKTRRKRARAQHRMRERNVEKRASARCEWCNRRDGNRDISVRDRWRLSFAPRVDRVDRFTIDGNKRFSEFGRETVARRRNIWSIAFQDVSSW